MAHVLFYLFGAVAVVCGLAMVLARNPVYGAVYLIACLIAVAGVFLVLDAPLLAALQVLVYTGAIMVLYLFVIMLLNLRHDPGFRWWRSWRTYVALGLTGLTGILIVGTVPYWMFYRQKGFGDSQVREIGRLMWGDPTLVLMVETLAVLLLVAVIGAIYLGRRFTPDEEAAMAAEERSDADRTPEGAT